MYYRPAGTDIDHEVQNDSPILLSGINDQRMYDLA